MSLYQCPECGEPVLYIRFTGPSPADRYAEPCGHRLLIDDNATDDNTNATDTDDSESDP